MADNNPVLELTKTAMALAAELYDYRDQMIWCHSLPEDADANHDELESWYTSKTEEILGLAEEIVKVFGPVPASNPEKVFLIDADNGEDYEDYQHWIEKVFLNKAEAEDYLVNQGWEEPESDSKFNRQFWHKHEEAYGWPIVRSAQILEYDIGAGI